MPQYFLKGWISAYPGEGVMKFTLPPDTINVTWNTALQDSTESGLISIESGYQDETQAYENIMGEVRHAWVKWNNSSDHDIFFDYEITPLYASSAP